MAAPIIPILKKVAVALVSDKKGRKWLLGIILGVLFIVLMPIIAVLGIFSGGIDLNIDGLFDKVYEQQAKMEVVVAEIEETMLEDGFTQTQVEEAQTLYVFALHDEAEEDGFVERLIGCFTIADQTDEELVSAVNTEFGKDIKTEDFQNAVAEFRDTQVSNES
ncbi:MAG: hypothetical protein IJ393_00870 [Clostridia bacterium]|nr:hypothetical protein [Clostridia bacterium]